MTENNLNKKLFNTSDAAQYLGSTTASLTTLRSKGRLNIPYIKFGNRIKYKKEDLDTWIANNTINPNKKEDGDVQA